MATATTSAQVSLTTATPTVVTGASVSLTTAHQVASPGAALSATTGLATTSITFAQPEVYTARFVTTLAAPITDGLRPTVISVSATQAAFSAGTYSIAIYDAGTDTAPTNFEALEVMGGGASLNWTVTTEQGWTPLLHPAGSTVVATVLTPRSITQPLNNHITPLNSPDPHSIYLRKASYSRPGDLVIGTGGSGQFTTLPSGADGQALVADSTRTGGLKWLAVSFSNVMQHAGDLIVGGVLGALTRLGIGQIGQVLGVVRGAASITTPGTAPTCAAGPSGGSLVNGTLYDFAYAWATPTPSPDGGETALSPIAAFAATTTGTVVVQCPAAPAANLTLNVYIAAHAVSSRRRAGSLPNASTTTSNSITVSALAVSPAPLGSSTNTTGGLTPGWVSTGNVSSVGLTMPTDYVVNGSPIFSSGILDVEYVQQFPNTVMAGPNTPGFSGFPTYRSLASADMPATFVVTGEVGASDFDANGLTGATAGSRYVGATTSGAPTSGTFLLGDFIIDQTGIVWICTVGGSPGTWVKPLDYVQSLTAPAVATSGTINTVGFTESRVAPTGNVTGVILQSGTTPGQQVVVTNESAFTITFAASGTSHVVDGTADVIAATSAKFFVWDSGTNLWYPAGGGSAGMTNPMTTAGDMIVGGASGAPARFAGGTSGFVLTSTGPTSTPAWQAATGGGGGSGGSGVAGGLVPIQTQTPSGINTVTFSVPAGFRNIRFTIQARSDTAATSTMLQLQFNGDTGSNYDDARVYGSNTVGADVSGPTTFARLAEIAAGTSPANAADVVVLTIPNHAGIFRKLGTATGGVTRSDTVSGNAYAIAQRIQWRSTAAITSVTLFLLAGNFVSGSTITLWGEADTAPALLTSNSNLIQETILTASQATLSVPNIPQGYKDLRISFSLRSDTGTAQSVLAQLNGDTGSSYEYQRTELYFNSNAPFGTSSALTTAGTLVRIPGSGSNVGSFVNGFFFIADYANSINWKVVNAFGGGDQTTLAASGEASMVGEMTWHNTAPVTSFQLSLASGNFVAGCVVRVYGEPASAAGPSLGTGTRIRLTTSQSIPSAVPALITWNTNDTDAALQHLLNPVPGPLSGTVAVSLGSQTLTGTGTSFTTQIAVGQVIQIPASSTVRASAVLSARATLGNNTTAPSDTTGFASATLGATAGLAAFGAQYQTFVVTAVASNTQLTVSPPATVAVSTQVAATLLSAISFPNPGMYAVDLGAYLAAVASGNVTVQIRLNGTTIIGQEDGTGISASASYNVSTTRNFQQWDYIEALVTQSSGAAVVLIADERTHFSVNGRPTMIVAVPYIYIQDRKPAGTDAGTFTSGADRTRDLNTTVSDTAGIATLASNQITLPAGTYRTSIQCPADGVNQHRAWLYNVTDSVEVLGGTNGLATSLDWSYIKGKFVLTATKTLEVRHRCRTTGATNGFGASVNTFFTVPFEVYTVVELWKEG